MGKNYTKPYDENYEDQPEDYFYLAMTFSQALGEILDDGTGILLDLKGEALHIHPEAKRIIVFNDGDMVRVVDASERDDLNHGDWIKMIKQDNISN